MPMPAFTNVRLMFAVANRELTSILRGKAERLLFIWTSMLALPLITLGVLAVFLMLRTTDILSPARIAIATADARSAEVQRLISDLRGAPDLILLVVDDPANALTEDKCDVVLTPDFAHNSLKLTSNNAVVERTADRAIELARRKAVSQVLPGNDAGSVFAYSIHLESMYRSISRQAGRQLVIGAVYALAFLYASVWLIPAIDVVRFDFLHNNIYANLSLPVPMNVVTGGKLLSGIVITLLPTVLSGVSFAFSAALGAVAFIDYYGANMTAGALSMQDIFGATGTVPWAELALLPWLLLLSIGFLHSWLTMVVVFLQGQRLSFSAALFSLLLWVQFYLAFGAFAPADALWVNAVPFFGLAACVHQITVSRLTLLGLVLASVSTMLLTVFFVARAGAFYSLEPWSVRSRAIRKLQTAAK